MRKFILPLAALALVAGCKGTAPEAVATDAMASEAAMPGAMPAAMPALAADAKKVMLAGTYAGAAGSLKLNSDMTYAMTGADGKSASGKYAWYSDNKRILLTGDKSVWAVADGALYKLASKDAPLVGFTADQLYTKAP